MFSDPDTKAMKKVFRSDNSDLKHEETVFFGKNHVSVRKTQAYTIRNRAIYRYAGKSRKHFKVGDSEAGLLVKKIARKAERWLRKAYGIDVKFNTAIHTHYPSKGDKSPSQSKNGLPYHDDLSRSNLRSDSPVVSFVFGEARPILFRRKDNRSKQFSVTPGDGDTYVMLPGCQEVYEHCVSAGHEARDSITLRCVQK